MSAIEAERLASVRAAIVKRDPQGRIVRRVAIGYLVALVAAPPITAAGLALVGHFDQAAPSTPVHRVVQSRCVNGSIHQGIDTGRADGLLLARTTAVSC
ncbi:hypothetical protein LWF15_09510 [Kineosporia rhizophila]|uniref:hypothetical protein n=1 Tax=Kineosporia rhizophila TaxID=84633 RepID=UPI001E589D82|nr:hypothetical protein [Kineosporia rhizophila]MCE0535750.1 hypothetical protein [Kineosporia rhizophila]